MKTLPSGWNGLQHKFLMLLVLLLLTAPVPASAQAPTYPIDAEVLTTLERTIEVTPLPSPATPLLPRQVSEYATYGYGLWQWNAGGQAFVRPDPTMQSADVEPSVPDPAAATLLTFFTMSDIHIADKESPAQAIYGGYCYPEPTTPPPEARPTGNSSAYSAVILSTTHVLDAAVQTINALHKAAPFDFGISLGDAANNTQYNELRWYIDVLDGRMITPSSGAHAGARDIDYQKRYQAAGLDRSIPWYQTIGNHDQFWMGSSPVSDYLRQTYTGSAVLNFGPITSLPPDFATILNTRGNYMGVVDGRTEFGEIIKAGPTTNFPTPPRVVADPDRRSLRVSDWMREFQKSTSNPQGHGFTDAMIRDEFACYHFYPRADLPIKVIVLDDTDKVGGGAAASLDRKRFHWLTQELDAGEAAGELMVICAHIPLRPYADPSNASPDTNPYYPLWSLYDPYSEVSEDDVLAKLHSYKNLILWISGHVHRSAITPHPSPDFNPEYGFWEVETPSLRDFPQQFRRFEIVRNSDHTISIFALDVDPAVAAPRPGQAPSPAWKSRAYAVATQEIFKNPVEQGPNVDPDSGVYNAELVKQLSPAMQAKLDLIGPRVRGFSVRLTAYAGPDAIVTLSHTVTGSTPAQYMVSESPGFVGASWMPYAKAPAYATRTTPGDKTIYFKVKDGSGRESEAAHQRIVFRKGRLVAP